MFTVIGIVAYFLEQPV